MAKISKKDAKISKFWMLNAYKCFKQNTYSYSRSVNLLCTLFADTYFTTRLNISCAEKQVI